MKITKLLILSIVLLLVVGLPIIAQNQQSRQGDKWPPEDLVQLEEKIQELQAQVITLERYSPEKARFFKDQAVIKQMVELLEYNKRKFDLLVTIYNEVEDSLFPFLTKYSQEHPTQRNAVLQKMKEYYDETKDNENSIYRIQESINHIALNIEMLEKRIEDLQLLERSKELDKESEKEPEGDKQTMTVKTRINLLEDERSKYTEEIEDEKARLNVLKEKEEEKIKKITEKKEEIESLKKNLGKLANPAERVQNQVFIKVREIRLNGLEIPQLNAAKTFVYIAENNIKTFDEKINAINADIQTLEKQLQEEIIAKMIRGGIVILIALVLVFLLIRLSIFISNKLLKRVEESEKLDDHRKQRLQTLSAVTLSFIRIFLWVMAVLLVMGELEIDYGPFLVAAGGISLAVGFGAQSLVKDVVTGFFLLMEEQFALGDSVDINGKIGTVEKISLRTIKFRALDGTLHTIPNGSISSVSNKTYQWSRAVVKVGVSYDESPENVLETLSDICKDIAEDAKWKDVLIEPPIAQGILSLGESAIEFRILAKTLPGEQWGIERELNIRIKNIFDQKGIEIPYNYLNVIDRTDRKETEK